MDVAKAGDIPQNEVDALLDAWRQEPLDIGVGLYNPETGEIHVGSYDTAAQGAGHQGLADALGIKDNSKWRGFLISSTGTAVNRSHFNATDRPSTGNAHRMRDEYYLQVGEALKRAGLAK